MVNQDITGSRTRVGERNLFNMISQKALIFPCMVNGWDLDLGQGEDVSMYGGSDLIPGHAGCRFLADLNCDEKYSTDNLCAQKFHNTMNDKHQF
jgi:hypothetical protein